MTAKNPKTYIFLLFYVISSQSSAGWFGPDNYEECVLEKMKGQNTLMIFAARGACEKMFPYEKKLQNYKKNIEIGWLSEWPRISLSIKKNYGNYTITRYEASFSTKSCDETENDSDYTLTKLFVFSDNKKSASVSLGDDVKYQCMRTNTIWGKRRKR